MTDANKFVNVYKDTVNITCYSKGFPPSMLPSAFFYIRTTLEGTAHILMASTGNMLTGHAGC